ATVVARALLPARQRCAEAAGHGDLARLPESHQLALDAPLAALLVLPDDAPLAGDRVARPHAGGEADLVAAEVLRTDEVGHALRDEPGGQHAVAEDGRVSGHLRELLVVVDRVEVPRGARVADEVGAR